MYANAQFAIDWDLIIFFSFFYSLFSTCYSFALLCFFIIVKGSFHSHSNVLKRWRTAAPSHQISFLYVFPYFFVVVATMVWIDFCIAVCVCVCAVCLYFNLWFCRFFFCLVSLCLDVRRAWCDVQMQYTKPNVTYKQFYEYLTIKFQKEFVSKKKMWKEGQKSKNWKKYSIPTDTISRVEVVVICYRTHCYHCLVFYLIVIDDTTNKWNQFLPLENERTTKQWKESIQWAVIVS